MGDEEEVSLTSADPGGSVEIILMSTAVVLTFSKQQNFIWVTTRCTDSSRVTGQTLQVTC